MIWINHPAEYVFCFKQKPLFNHTEKSCLLRAPLPHLPCPPPQEYVVCFKQKSVVQPYWKIRSPHPLCHICPSPTTPLPTTHPLCAQWVAKDLSLLHADSEYSDQNGPRLMWVFTGRTCHFVGFVMRWLKSTGGQHYTSWSWLFKLVTSTSNFFTFPYLGVDLLPCAECVWKNIEIDKMLQLSLAMYLNDPMFLDRQVWAQIRLNDFYTVASFGHITQYHITTAFKFYDNYAIFVDVHFFFFTISWVLQFLYYY